MQLTKIKELLIKYFSNPKIQWSILLLIAIGVSIQALLEGSRSIDGGIYTHYNNYLIFKQSFYHLISFQDLYARFPAEHFDLFKYSSTFAALFGVFAIFPDWLGLPLWNVFNLVFFFFALRTIPQLNNKWVGVILLLAIFELITTSQNEQSNTFMLGLFLFAFSSLERKQYFLAALCIVLSIYTKLYGVVVISMVLLYPERLKSSFYIVFWGIALFLVPLIFIDWHQLIFNYHSWFSLLGVEHGQIYGISVMGWLNSWFGLEVHKLIPVIIGAAIFCLPLFRFKLYQNYKFRLLALCSVLIWVVIFNHRAESASYIIAYIGVCIWFVIGQKSRFNIALIIIAFILVSISPTDLFPRFLREEYVQAYALKAVPVIFIWGKIIFEMMTFQKTEEVNIS